MKFKIGDRIRIKDDFKTNQWFGDLTVIEDMVELQGKEAEVMSIDSQGDIILDISPYYFSPKMLELIHEDNGERECETEERKSSNKKPSLDMALELLGVTEDELLREYYKKDEIKDIKDIKVFMEGVEDRFDKYCLNRRNCTPFDCKIKKFKDDNDLNEVGTCRAIYAMCEAFDFGRDEEDKKHYIDLGK